MQAVGPYWTNPSHDFTHRLYGTFMIMPPGSTDNGRAFEPPHPPDLEIQNLSIGLPKASRPRRTTANALTPENPSVAGEDSKGQQLTLLTSTVKAQVQS